MIPQLVIKQQPTTWQQALREIITDPFELLSLLKLSADQIPWQWDKQFPLRVPKSFVERMQSGDPHDPLLRQVLSIKDESKLSNFYSLDPLEETHCNPVPGLLHKFSSRVLLTFTGSCAIHCRYCFRRHFPYEKNNPGRNGWSGAIDYIAAHPQVFEVILSGGDPLMAQDEALALFLQQLAKIPHVTLLRFHTRLPVVIPQRICSSLLKVLSDTRFQVVMVYHINHPNEIIPAISEGVTQLKQQQITVLNQAVLLQGINDNIETLKKLSVALFQNGILPYYVNMPDAVQGTRHFNVALSQAKALQAALRAQLPGYLVPKFVQEIPRHPSKVPIDQLP